MQLDRRRGAPSGGYTLARGGRLQPARYGGEFLRAPADATRCAGRHVTSRAGFRAARAGTDVSIVPAARASFPVAVIGMACRFPGAADKETFWRNLVAGVDSVSTVPPSRWDAQALYARRHEPGRTVSQWGGFIEGVETGEPGSLRPRARKTRRIWTR